MKQSAKKAAQVTAPQEITDAASLLEQGIKTKFPAKLSPMLASLAKGVFNKEGWSYEVKWDGFRALTFINNGTLEIRSRNNKSFNEQFYPLYDLLKTWKLNVVLDGEIVAVNEKGTANFNKLQGWRSEADGELIYYVFDILWLEGYDVTGLTLTQRRAILEQYLPVSDMIRISQQLHTSGEEAFAIAQKMRLEGVIAKNNDSLYQPGLRTRDWMKIKTHRRQEVVIGGYTINEGTPKLFSSLLIGVYNDGKLHFSGKVGTGFNKKMQEEMMAQFRKVEAKTCPFVVEPDVNQPSRFRPDPPKAAVVWLKPKLVGEVSYQELTRDGVMRHPSFEGMRADKDVKDVVFEQEVELTTNKDYSSLAEKKIIAPAVSTGRKTLLNPKDETQVRDIEGKQLKFTNLSKVFWPEENVTKRDMLNYYYRMAQYIIPYLKDRPLTLNRHPNGIYGKSFYQKDVKGKAPSWIKTFPYYSHTDQREKEFMVCMDEPSLMYAASLGCIEMNPWSSRTKKPDNPDWCIIDLDPDNNPFEQVIEAAQVTKQLLDEIEVPAYCKTSGSTGLHIYIPLGAKYTYEDSKEFARKLVKIVHKRLPKYTSIERKTADRAGKLYLDFLQNRPQATVAAPYSLRPKPGATVSMPLYWDEVKKGLSMKDFTIFNAVQRAESAGDLFGPVCGKGINLNKILATLEVIFKEEKLK